MQHLRIMGVREAEEQDDLILADESGTEYALPVDEALRAAVNRAAHRPARTQDVGAQGAGPLSPRDIQAWMRAGATIEQVVADSGLDAAHVERYAGPVQAERAYIAQRARGAEIAPASTAEQHRVAFGDAAATLEAMVSVRLRAAGVDLRSLSWDAWRREDGRWKVLCWFDAHGATGDAPTPPAEWIFTPESKHLLADGPAAEELSSLPSAARPARGGRRLAPVDAPYDVESDEHPGRSSGAVRRGPLRPVPAEEQDTSPVEPPRGAPAETSDSAESSGPADHGRAAGPSGPAGPSGAAGEGDEQEALLEMLRRRRGQRLGADEQADDELAMMLTREEHPASGPRDDAEHGDSADDDADAQERSGGAAPSPVTPLRPVDDAAGEDRGSGRPVADEPSDTDREHPTEPIARPGERGPSGGTDAWGFSYEEGGDDAQDPEAAEEAGRAGDRRRGSGGAADTRTSGGEDDPEGERGAPRARRASRRPSMPRWDDILFGSRDD
ncbi:septation protein SepH [Nesterenkonia sp. F]|uniref:septation protein SepH n=1 Tax=Nesterenkonia sp. F TaxID=795955 RepID=UPI000255D067|nr:septation protein SepH [Nesterenkonia sp. F]